MGQSEPLRHSAKTPFPPPDPRPPSALCVLRAGSQSLLCPRPAPPVPQGSASSLLPWPLASLQVGQRLLRGARGLARAFFPVAPGLPRGARAFPRCRLPRCVHSSRTQLRLQRPLQSALRRVGVE